MKLNIFYLHLAYFVIYFKINISMIGGQWKIHRNSSCCFFPYKIKNNLIIFCLKEIHSWWNCCGFWIHITITVHLIIFIANQSTFRPRKTFATFLLDAMNLKMVEKNLMGAILWIFSSGFRMYTLIWNAILDPNLYRIGNTSFQFCVLKVCVKTSKINEFHEHII